MTRRPFWLVQFLENIIHLRCEFTQSFHNALTFVLTLQPRQLSEMNGKLTHLVPQTQNNADLQYSLNGPLLLVTYLFEEVTTWISLEVVLST